MAGSLELFCHTRLDWVSRKALGKLDSRFRGEKVNAAYDREATQGYDGKVIDYNLVSKKNIL